MEKIVSDIITVCLVGIVVLMAVLGITEIVYHIQYLFEQYGSK